MKTLKTIAVLCVLFAIGCGSRTVGFNTNNTNNNNSNVNTNTNQNNNNVTQPEILTRRRYINETVEDELGYEQDPTRPCERSFPDLQDTPEDNRLCRNLMIHADIRAPISGSANGLLEPDLEMGNAEVWQQQLRTIGLFLYPEAAPGDDVDQSDWYAGAAGNWAYKGILSPDASNMVYPSNKMTIVEWNAWKSRMQNWLIMGVTRISFIEVLLTSLLSGPIYGVTNCVSEHFADIASYSFECVVTNTAISHNVIDNTQPNFRSQDTMNWAEMVSMSLAAASIPASTSNTCWNHCSINDWYCGRMNAACERGLLPSNLEDATDTPSRLQAFRFLQKMEMLNL